jgi:hypothetical protein
MTKGRLNISIVKPILKYKRNKENSDSVASYLI